MEIQYLGHSSFLIQHNGTQIIIDPYFTQGPNRLVKPGADPRELKPRFVLVTHEHFDHCDPQAIRMFVKRSNAKVIGPAPVERKTDLKIVKVRPGMTLKYDDFTLIVTPAFHKQSEFPIGFLLDFDGFRIYHAGDTYYNKKLEDINTDIALLPIGGTYTMDIDEAVKLAHGIGASVTIPMHYQTFENIMADPAEFAKQVKGAVVLPIGEVIELGSKD